MGTAGKLNAALTDLLYQALQTEQGGIRVYEQAITCAVNDDLKEEWTKYLEETRRHEQVVLSLLVSAGLDPDLMTPGREVVAGIGDALVGTIKKAKAKGTREQAQIVASECVVLAETKDHANWELLAHVAEKGTAAQKAFLKDAVEEVENEEDHHLFHTKGWMRELWIQELGFPAVLPPPEEVRQVETAIGASRAEQDRDKFM